MKVYLNRKPRIGPWGGGNKSLSLLCQKLKKLSHEVVFDLNNGDIDIIFCYDPRPNETGEWYQSFLSYRQNNPKCKIIQRVGDAGTHGKPELTSLVSESAKYSDFLIFPSFWVKNYIEFTGNNFTVIPNRPPSQFFQFRENRAIGKKLKLVTHHWSTNPKKGFKTYEFLASLSALDSDLDFELTYIGRTPEDFNSKNIKSITPKDAEFLCRELPKHDIYFTASIEEAGANHVLEGMAAGLPVIYHSLGGSIPEYCDGYGESFSSNHELGKKIKEIISSFKNYKDKVLGYDQKIDQTVREYCEIIHEI